VDLDYESAWQDAIELGRLGNKRGIRVEYRGHENIAVNSPAALVAGLLRPKTTFRQRNLYCQFGPVAAGRVPLFRERFHTHFEDWTASISAVRDRWWCIVAPLFSPDRIDVPLQMPGKYVVPQLRRLCFQALQHICRQVVDYSVSTSSFCFIESVVGHTHEPVCPMSHRRCALAPSRDCFEDGLSAMGETRACLA